MIPYTAKVNERAIGQSISNEQHTIGIVGVATYASLQIALIEVPQGPAPAVTITGTGGPYNEVTFFPTLGGQFQVNYTTGIITFAPGQNGEVVFVDYIGLGSEIAAQDVNEVQEPLNSIAQLTLTYNPPFTAATSSWTLAPGLAVTTINGLQNGVTLQPGPSGNVTITTLGNNIIIDSTGGGGGSTPGGTNGSVQFNVASTSLGGDASHFFYDSTNFRLGLATGTPLSNVDINGSFGTGFRITNSTTTMTATDYSLYANASSGAITVNLPSATTCPRRIYVIKKIDFSANLVTIAANGFDLIDGASTFPMSVQYQTTTVQSVGNAWWII
jgi:hypothetical protein